MDAVTVSAFLDTEIDGAFEFMRQLREAGHPPKPEFLRELRDALANFSPAQVAQEGTADWAHVVSGLMIGADWDSNGFAMVAAPFLACQGTAVWTAAYRLLLGVSQLDQSTLDQIALFARDCPYPCDGLIDSLQHHLTN